ncbi:hypothetical protein BC834DRAFT_845006 [Gloeopeniophorella convolvens]|nr:hypothetical protein BC834DRAFT_845006 [Gloeopeniophorella convolvens]
MGYSPTRERWGGRVETKSGSQADGSSASAEHNDEIKPLPDNTVLSDIRQVRGEEGLYPDATTIHDTRRSAYTSQVHERTVIGQVYAQEHRSKPPVIHMKSNYGLACHVPPSAECKYGQSAIPLGDVRRRKTHRAIPAPNITFRFLHPPAHIPAEPLVSILALAVAVGLSPPNQSSHPDAEGSRTHRLGLVTRRALPVTVVLGSWSCSCTLHLRRLCLEVFGLITHLVVLVLVTRLAVLIFSRLLSLSLRPRCCLEGGLEVTRKSHGSSDSSAKHYVPSALSVSSGPRARAPGSYAPGYIYDLVFIAINRVSHPQHNQANNSPLILATSSETVLRPQPIAGERSGSGLTKLEAKSGAGGFNDTWYAFKRDAFVHVYALRPRVRRKRLLQEIKEKSCRNFVKATGVHETASTLRTGQPFGCQTSAFPDRVSDVDESWHPYRESVSSRSTRGFFSPSSTSPDGRCHAEVLAQACSGPVVLIGPKSVELGYEAISTSYLWQYQRVLGIQILPQHCIDAGRLHMETHSGRFSFPASSDNQMTSFSEGVGRGFDLPVARSIRPLKDHNINKGDVSNANFVPVAVQYCPVTTRNNAQATTHDHEDSRVQRGHLLVTLTSSPTRHTWRSRSHRSEFWLIKVIQLVIPLNARLAVKRHSTHYATSAQSYIPTPYIGARRVLRDASGWAQQCFYKPISSSTRGRIKSKSVPPADGKPAYPTPRLPACNPLTSSLSPGSRKPRSTPSRRGAADLVADPVPVFDPHAAPR